MSNDVVISVDKLSKRYLVGHEGPQERYHSLRDTLVRHGRNFARKTLDMARGRQIVQGDEVEEFWALKDVSFEVKRGEVLGIIGRNGAGKSTLLKILSRITEPSSGRVVLDGRVASLLEVGTGFHPELTGRENVFLNGAILGMSKAEIRRKFDEIVDFSGVEKFLDTPVKRYSSGMYVRLAFAVAAHLEPEILIVDEVLAVGDQEFQKKCLGKMQDVATAGRTVLLVSHNMASVQSLSTSCCLLERGHLQRFDDPQDAIDRYNQSYGAGSGSPKYSYPVKSVQMNDAATGLSGDTIPIGETANFLIELTEEFDCEHFDLVLAFKHPQRERIMSASTHHVGLKFSTTKSRSYNCRIQNLRLLPGEYMVEVIVRSPSATMASSVFPFRVTDQDIYASGVVPNANFGIFAPEQAWSTITPTARQN